MDRKRFSLRSFTPAAAAVIVAAAVAAVSAISFCVYAAVAPAVTDSQVYGSRNKNAVSYNCSDPLGEGLILKSLWKEYRKAQEKDLPAKSEKILSEIKKEANYRHLVYDYYKAANEYVDVVSSINWKLRDSLVSKRDDEFKEFGEPLLLYLSGMVGDGDMACLKFLENNSDALKSSSHNCFWYAYPSGYKGKILAAYYENDYEYVLAGWMFGRFQRSSSMLDLQASVILKYLFHGGVGSRYPFNALWELRMITGGLSREDSVREAELNDYVSKYSGLPVVVLAENSRLELHRNRIEKDGNASSEQYRQLRTEAVQVASLHRSFKGKEAELLEGEDYAQSLIDCLDASSVSLRLEKDSILVILRNLPDARVRICRDAAGKDEIFSATVTNNVKSYYRPDTLCVASPELSDGRYYFFASSGKQKCESYHSRYSLAAQLTETPEGVYIYLADRNNGRPVEVADIEVVSSEKTIAKASSVRLSGMTLLPHEISDSLLYNGRRVRYLRCTSRETGVVRMTDLLSLNGFYYDGLSASSSVSVDSADSGNGDSGSVRQGSDSSLIDSGLNRINSEDFGLDSIDSDTSDFSDAGNMTLRGSIFLDKSAFYPGETLHFKAVCYYDDGNGGMRTLRAGKNVCVTMTDASGKEVGNKSLVTNDYGSVSDTFAIPSGSYRNGSWRVSVSADGNILDTQWIVVDEYELPSFNVTFERDDRLYFPGDTVPVHGKVISYAGNSLSGTEVKYELWKMSLMVDSGSVDVSADGEFNVPIESFYGVSWACYRLTVKVTDEAGQTFEFSTNRTVADRFFIDIDSDASQFSEGLVRCGNSNVGSVRGKRFTAYGSSAENVRIIDGNSLSFSINASDADGRKVELPSAAHYYIERCDGAGGGVDRSGGSGVVDGCGGNGGVDGSTHASICDSGVWRTVATGSVVSGCVTVENVPVSVAHGIKAADRVDGASTVTIPLNSYPSGLYRIKAVCSARSSRYDDSSVSSISGDSAGSSMSDDFDDWGSDDSIGSTGSAKKAEAEMMFLILRDGDSQLDAAIESVIKVKEDKNSVRLQLGAGKGDVWTVFSLFDRQTHLKYTTLVHLGGIAGNNCSLTSLSIPYPQDCSGNMLLSAVYFRDGSYHPYVYECRRSQQNDFSKPLSVSSLEDSYSPGTEYVIRLSSEPNTEILASIFDRSTEDISPNVWRGVRPFTRSISLNTSYDTGEYIFRPSGMWIDGRRYYTKSASLAESKAYMDSAPTGSSNFISMEEDSVESLEAAVDRDYGNVESGDGGHLPLDYYRKDFRTVLAFEPFITADSSGNAEIRFRTSDKLSTYILSVFAHDVQMHNSVSRSEFVVNSPVALTVHAPSFLYSGDRYDMTVSVSNNSGSDVAGMLTASVPFLVQSVPVTVVAGGSEKVKFSITVPDGSYGDSYAELDRKLDLKVSFSCKTPDGVDCSDALMKEVGLRSRKQVLTESHSAVYRYGMDRDSLLRSIEAEFVNTSHFGAVHTERTIADMSSEMLAAQTAPASNNVFDLVKALYSNVMLASLDSSAAVSPADAGSTDTDSSVVGSSDAESSDLDSSVAESSDVDSSVAGFSDTDSSDAESSDAGRSVSELLEKILLCRTASGGFGWYAGMQASPVITAVVVEDLALLVREGKLCVRTDVTKSPGVDEQQDAVKSTVVAELTGGTETISAVELTGGTETASAAGRTGYAELPADVLTDAVKYIDSCYFSDDYASDWRGGVSTEQYVYLRSLFPEIPLSAEQLKSACGKKVFSEKISDLKDYLCPKSSSDKLNGRLLNKVRRASAALNFTRSGDNSFIGSIGSGVTLRRINRTLSHDMESIKEYAVGNPSCGIYFPNAVLPFRGLIENEAYAHSLICTLLNDWNDMLASGKYPSLGRTYRNGDSQACRIADGVRLWLVLQKDTQKWDCDPAFVNAVNTILSGSDTLLATSVVVLSKTYEKPFSEIKASGNGLKIDKEYFVEKQSVPAARNANVDVSNKSHVQRELVSLANGAELSVGDKVIVRYKVWNGENRSFVRLSLPYNACLRPVSQLSGCCGWGTLAPYFARSASSGQAGGTSAAGIHYSKGWCVPQGYREVRSDRIVYDFDVLPEETTVIEDEFYVSQSGVFTVPVAEVESLYATHYRANSAYTAPIMVSR